MTLPKCMLCSNFNENSEEISQLASDITITPELQKALMLKISKDVFNVFI